MKYILLLSLLFLVGCGVFQHRLPVPTGPAVVTTAGLAKTAFSLTGLIWLGVVGLSIGAAAYFFLPGDHRLPMATMALGGSLLVISLFIQSTLWLLPWVFGFLLIVGGAWLGMAVYRKAKLEKLIQETT